MKKLFLMMFLLCFMFSSFAALPVPKVEKEKHKTEKVFFETVAIAKQQVVIDKPLFLADVVVQRQRIKVIDKISYSVATIQENSFNTDRYWCRNFKEPYKQSKDFNA